MVCVCICLFVCVCINHIFVYGYPKREKLGCQSRYFHVGEICIGMYVVRVCMFLTCVRVCMFLDVGACANHIFVYGYPKREKLQSLSRHFHVGEMCVRMYVCTFVYVCVRVDTISSPKHETLGCQCRYFHRSQGHTPRLNI
jgi:hypothetical protein